MRNIALWCGLSLAIAVAFTASFWWASLGSRSDLLFYIYSPLLLFAIWVSGNVHDPSVPACLVGLVVENFLIIVAVGSAIIGIRRWTRKKRKNN